MYEREKFDNGILSVRFRGDDIQMSRGVSIYDLGETLLAIQRIVHKAYLARHGRLAKGAYPNKEERPELALQLGERKRQSDAFALIPILADPNVRSYLTELAGYVFSGIVGYYTQDLLDRVHKETDNDKKIFIGSIYTEVANIVNRVDTTGGVGAISLGAPSLQRETIASFNKDTKDYLADLKNQTFLGAYQEIKGEVYKFYPASNIVAIRRSGGTTVNVFLNRSEFEKIRYHQETKPRFLFKGHPVYRFGIETKSVSEFDADEIIYIPREES